MSGLAADVIADLLTRGHSVRFRASGHSMHPIIHADDYLLVEPIGRFAPGDVVLTLGERGLTAHRVIAVGSDGVVVTRGDNAPAPDPPVEARGVLGVVTYAERNGKMRRVRRAGSVVLAVTRLALRAAARLR